MKLMITALAVTSCFSQTPAPQPSPAPLPPIPVMTVTTPLPDDGVMIGGGYGPHFKAWASYFKLVSTKGQVYAFWTTDAQIIKDASNKPVVATSARAGFATILRVFGPVYVLGFATAGGSTTGQITAASFEGGGMAAWHIGKTGWIIGPAVRRNTSAVTGPQNFYELGLGRIKTQ